MGQWIICPWARYDLKASFEGQHISSCNSLAAFALEISLLVNNASLSVEVDSSVMG